MRQPGRFLWLGAWLSLGILPSVAFLAWIERNCALPWVGRQLAWPWLDVVSLPVPALGVIDLVILLLGAAGPAVLLRRGLFRLLPPAAHLASRVVGTGLCLTVVMGSWQSTGIVLWALPLSRRWQWAVSMILFWGLLGVSAFRARKAWAGAAGIAQLYGAPAPEVRRPSLSRACLLVALAITLTPFMTLDRVVVLLAYAIWVAYRLRIDRGRAEPGRRTRPSDLAMNP